MKILHVISGLGTGGAERMLQRIVTAEADTSITHEVICLGQGGDIAGSLLTHGVQVSILNGKGRLSAPRVLLQAEDIAKNYKPDVIQGWMYDGNMAASWLGWKTNIPCLWNVRHSIADIKREKLDLRLAVYLGSLICSSADAIIYNSKIAANQHKKLGFCAEKQIVIPNGFDINTLKPGETDRARIRQELSVSNDAWLVGMIARYHPMKDHTMFLNAALSVCENNNNVYFLLAGKGVDAENSQLMSTIENSGFASRFRFLGERRDVVAIHSALDLAVSSSAWGEGFSNVLGEAMSAGVPCIATDVGDAEYILGSTGMVVPPENKEKMAGAIEQMLSDKSKLKDMGRAARERIVENFSLDHVLDKYTQLWSNSVCKHSKSKIDQGISASAKHNDYMPTFYIPGAPKCGTTAIASWLSTHPDIFMSEIKEPQFFNTDMNNRIIESMERYQGLFKKCPRAVKHRGEASVWYLYSDSAIENILSITPDARFIVLLRNPIDMAVSLHRQKVFNGEEPIQQFEDAWNIQEQRESGDHLPWSVAEPSTLQYGKVCKLGEQVARLLSRVARENVLFILHEELAGNPRESYVKALQFLQLEDDGRSDFPRVNEAKEPRLMIVQKMLRAGDKIRRKLHIPRYGYELTSAVRRMNTLRPLPVQMDATTYQDMLRYFNDDISLLAELTGFELSHWQQMPGDMRISV